MVSTITEDKKRIVKIARDKIVRAAVGSARLEGYRGEAGKFEGGQPNSAAREEKGTPPRRA